MAEGNRLTKRLFNLDTRVYEEGTLSIKTKEMLRLVASAVLRYDDCTAYHVVRCFELGISDLEFFELFNVALVVGNSIIIPHFRRAVEFLEECWRSKPSLL